MGNVIVRVARLENRQWETIREFESRPLRQHEVRGFDKIANGDFGRPKGARRARAYKARVNPTLSAKRDITWVGQTGVSRVGHRGAAALVPSASDGSAASAAHNPTLSAGLFSVVHRQTNLRYLAVAAGCERRLAGRNIQPSAFRSTATTCRD